MSDSDRDPGPAGERDRGGASPDEDDWGGARPDDDRGTDHPRRGDGRPGAAEAAPGGRAALVRALNVRRNALLGFGIAALLTGAVFVRFVVVPGSLYARASSPLYYVALAFVLAASLGGLLAAVFTFGSAIRLIRED